MLSIDFNTEKRPKVIEKINVARNWKMIHFV